VNEFQLIAQLAPTLATAPHLIVGAGDDCAVIDVGLAAHWLLFKTDAVVESVHFEAEADPAQVGHKALARALSDVAAMAGEPLSALITLALPDRFSTAWVQAAYQGLNRLARKHSVSIAGGETTRSPGPTLLSVAVVGRVAKDRCLLRSGGQPGDALFVTGELGGSLQGRHLTFQPRLAEAQWLARHGSIHAMIDLSDGLAGDLRHILDASGVGAELRAASIPIARAAKNAARAGSAAKPPLLAALTDGEDFELLFSAAAADAVGLLDAWKNRFPNLRLTCIGKLTTQPGLRLRDHQGVRTLDRTGYAHFAKPSS